MATIRFGDLQPRARAQRLFAASATRSTRKKRPFQGWRYLEPGDAPSDLDGKGPALSADLEVALKEALAW